MLAMVLQGLGAAFLLIAAIGVIRLPDPLQRMHSATKAGTLGTALLLVGVMASGQVDRSSTAWLAIIFLLVTLPLGAQLLARGTYLSGTRLQGLEDDPLADELGDVRDQRHDHAGRDLG
ncbi:monovalent cation/H(+) antiporter subunit G [Croceibacterium sp. TMG7-5b_MA50]|uniref:monovalent cation/H(+) antiporter subunit G n=1 Tax=Croceibacterium sp. TMG7-5b_MA50 TaxID=3121290 RepID=UPI003221FA02